MNNTPEAIGKACCQLQNLQGKNRLPKKLAKQWMKEDFSKKKCKYSVTKLIKYKITETKEILIYTNCYEIRNMIYIFLYYQIHWELSLTIYKEKTINIWRRNMWLANWFQKWSGNKKAMFRDEMRVFRITEK